MESATDVRLDGDEMTADTDDGDAGHATGTYVRVTSRLLAFGYAVETLGRVLEAMTSTPSAPSAGGRSRTGTAGSSRVQRVSTSVKSVSICAPRF